MDSSGQADVSAACQEWRDGVDICEEDCVYLVSEDKQTEMK